MLDQLIQAYPDIKVILENDLKEVTSLLQRYMDEIELFNPAYGLVSVQTRQELITKHILDSLAPLGILSRILEKKKREVTKCLVADIGSGAGLPGIPLAITMPDHSFTLIERMGRRAGFLRNTTAVLGLKNVEIEEKDMEKTQGGLYHLVTLRAFRSLDSDVLQKLYRLLTPDGTIAAYKGRKEKIMAEIDNAQLRNNWELITCPVPCLDEERNLLLIKRPITVA